MSIEARVDIAILQRDRDEAQRSVTRGCVLIVLVPVLIGIAFAFAVMFHSIAPLIVAAMYAAVGGVAGVASLGVGAFRLRHANKELARIEAERIPPARLLT